MTHFPYVDGELHVEQVPVRRIADEVGTPFYCLFQRRADRQLPGLCEDPAARSASASIYSLKANSNQAVIRTLGKLGAGADVVSVGEMHRALKAGIPADKIVFAGVGKTELEMEAALEGRHPPVQRRDPSASWRR